MKRNYSVTGIHCGSCVEKIRQTLDALPEIRTINVSKEPPLAEIVFQTVLPVDVLNQKLKSAGAFVLQELDRPQSDRSTFSANDSDDERRSFFSTYKPLLLIFFFIVGFTILKAYADQVWKIDEMMYDFMAGFFIVFSFFKFLNLNGFAEAYRVYDIIAKKFKPYGYVYPFIELFLGVAYFLRFQTQFVNGFMLVVMAISLVGVVQKLAKKEQIQCACLGTVFNLPMTYVTVFEDGLMVAMSFIMLFFHFS